MLLTWFLNLQAQEEQARSLASQEERRRLADGIWRSDQFQAAAAAPSLYAAPPPYVPSGATLPHPPPPPTMPPTVVAPPPPPDAADAAAFTCISLGDSPALPADPADPTSHIAPADIAATARAAALSVPFYDFSEEHVPTCPPNADPAPFSVPDLSAPPPPSPPGRDQVGAEGGSC